ncbi:Methanogenesis regulatory histidine kinase FilI [uncultured archaeon]|nr:Methanogenesis regulatory histidine kinase FilI [uncultured archaeon]
MKIRTQLIISMVFFAVALAIISASVITTNHQVEALNKQEELAKNIELKVGELSYLSNDYLLYHESQQIDRWEAKYSSFSEDASNLTVDGSDQQVLVNNIKANGQRLKKIFGDVVSRIESAPPLQQSTVGPAFIQVSWSRMGVQTQGIVFDASRLAQSLREQADQVQQKNTMLVFSLMGAFIALLLVNYLLFYRKTLRSIEFLQTGTRIIGSGNLDFSLEEKKNDEIGELSQSFNRMTANLKTVTASKADLEREIAERKLSEEALARERANLQAIFDVINVGMLLIDENGVVKRINNAVFQHFGEKNLLSKCSGQPGDVLGCLHAVNDPLGCGHTPHCTSCPIRNAFETVLRSGQSVNNIETEAALLIGGNEICIWLAVSADPLVLNGKKHAILAINDITERKQAMKDIESLAKFPEENPNSVMRIAANGAIVYANPSSAPLLKAWGCQVGGMLPDEYRNLILDAYRSGNRNEIEIGAGDTIYSIVLAPIVDMGYVNVYGRDVTQHKLADKALKESEQRFRDAIDNFPNVFVIYDADRRVTYVNSNGLQIMGLSEQEVIGRRDEEIFPPEMIDSYLPALKLAVQTKTPQALERTRPIRMGGQTIIANIIPLLDEGGEIRQILGITHDITERKHQEEQITRLTKLYSVLSRVNEAIVRVGEVDSLYSEIYRIVSEVGGYPLVWIGEVKEGLVMPVAWSGPASDYLLDIRVEVQGELGKGPTGTCIRDNRSVINDDFATNPATSPWREPAIRYGFRASAAIPLRLHGKVIGAFTLYATMPKAFDREQVGLLESLCADISYALDALEKEQLRVLAEEGLRETRDYLKNLIDYANAPIIVWDPSFRITRFNHAFERLTGLRAAEAIGERLDILFPEESRDRSIEYISRTLSGERWEVVEIPIKKIDGSVRTVLWNSANIYDKDGTAVVATIAQGQDITERKGAEEALRETKDYLENLIDYANAPIIVWDPSFRITRFNHAFVRLTGLDAQAVSGEPLDILFPEKSKEESLKYIKRTLSGERWETVEIPILRTDGSVRTVLWNSANIYDKDAVVATIAQGQDITDRKLAEEGLKAINDILKIANNNVDQVPLLRGAVDYLKNFSHCTAVGIRLLDEAGNIPYQAYDGFSQSFYELESPLSIKSDQCMCINVIKGDVDSKLPFYTDGGSFYMNGTTRFLATVSEEDKGRTRNVCNQVGYESVALVPIRFEERIFGLIQLSDPRENMVPLDMVEVVEKIAMQLGTAIVRVKAQQALKESEVELRIARDELEQRVQERTAELSKASVELEARAAELVKKTEDLARSNSELEQFAYVASHDLQEPLRMITSKVQLLSRRYDGILDKDADDFIAYAVDGTKRMQQLINDLLAYSRVGTRGKPPAPTDFEDVFREAMANLRMAAEEAGAVVTHDQLPTANADRLQMVQLFQNLIGNAIKFRGKDVPRVHVSARPVEENWVFSVMDNGIGIDPQFHDRIFTIFQRLHGREEYPGTGIGLAVSKKIVERHGGRIWLESELGKGTTFYFTVSMQAGQPEVEATSYTEQNEGR